MLLLDLAKTTIELVLALIQQDVVRIADGPVRLSILPLAKKNEAPLPQRVHQRHLGVGQTNLDGAVHPRISPAADRRRLAAAGLGGLGLGGRRHPLRHEEGLLVRIGISDEHSRRRRWHSRITSVVVVRHWSKVTILQSTISI